jgi:hypothetical protein
LRQKSIIALIAIKFKSNWLAGNRLGYRGLAH